MTVSWQHDGFGRRSRPMAGVAPPTLVPEAAGRTVVAPLTPAVRSAVPSVLRRTGRRIVGQW